LYLKKGIKGKNNENSVVLNSITIKSIPKNKKISLILFKKTALNADFVAITLVYQKFISKKEHIPTPSQPQKNNNKLSDKIRNIIKNVNKSK